MSSQFANLAHQPIVGLAALVPCAPSLVLGVAARPALGARRHGPLSSFELSFELGAAVGLPKRLREDATFPGEGAA